MKKLNILCITIPTGLVVHEKNIRKTKLFHSLSKRGLFQCSYSESTEEAKLFCTGWSYT